MSDDPVCDIFKSLRKEGMYLYVETERAMERVPEPLVQQFGRPEFVMTLTLTPQRKLARVSRDDVVQGLTEHGYFLQMPPGERSGEADI